MLGATLRARRVLSEAGIRSAGELVRAADTLNEVWFTGDLVLRITPNRTSQRLHHESAVASLLPPSVRYPEIVATGRSEAGEWMLTRRCAGQMLSRAWPTMTRDQRASAVGEVAEAMAAVHAIVPPPSFRPPFLDRSLECPHQLPAGRILDLIDRARQMPTIPGDVLDRVAAAVTTTMDALDPPGTPHGLIHGDLHFGNMLWDGHHISAMLDFEWSRVGPPDLDLDVLIRFLADPAAHVDAADREAASREAYAGVPALLSAAYPALFSHPRLLDRLRLYAISYDIRALLLEPPPRTLSEHLHVDHPLSRIRRLLERRDHLSML